METTADLQQVVKGRESKFLHGRLTEQILGCAIEVHRALGPGLLESAYRSCLVHELRSGGMTVSQEAPVPVYYKGQIIETAYRADIIVDDAVLLELKTADAFHPIHAAQVLTYLKFLNLKVGLLVNFNQTHLMKGVRRYAL